MRRSVLVTPALVLLIASTPNAWAAECSPSTSSPEIKILNNYIDTDYCQPECAYSVWYYVESNFIVGLQRNDEVVDDTCGGQIEGDSIVGGAFVTLGN